MKRYLSVLLILITVFSLCACTADNAAKYQGVWTDETGHTVLILKENGAASLRVGDYVVDAQKLTWTADSYEKISVWFVMKEVQAPTNTTEATEATEVTEATEPATAETAAATEATVATETTVPVEETIPAETTATTEPTEEVSDVLIVELVLTIKNGVMYLTSTDKSDNLLKVVLTKQK